MPVVIAAALFAAACTAPPAQPTTIEEIIERHIAVRGGLEKIRSIEAVHEKGRVMAGDHREGLISRERKRPHRARLEFKVQGVTSVMVSNGTTGWKMSPRDGDVEPQPLPERVITEMSEQAGIGGPLVDWKEKGHLVELAGRETIDGREAHKVKITLKSGAVRYEYLDAESFIKIRADAERQFRGRVQQLQTKFGNHKIVDGVLFPHLFEVEELGRPEWMRIELESIDVNPPISNSRFEMSPAAE